MLSQATLNLLRILEDAEWDPVKVSAKMRTITDRDSSFSQTSESGSDDLSLSASFSDLSEASNLMDQSMPWDASVSLAFDDAIRVPGSNNMLADESMGADISADSEDASFVLEFYKLMREFGRVEEDTSLSFNAVTFAACEKAVCNFGSIKMLEEETMDASISVDSEDESFVFEFYKQMRHFADLAKEKDTSMSLAAVTFVACEKAVDDFGSIKMLADESQPWDASISLEFEQAICIRSDVKMLADESAPFDDSVSLEFEQAICVPSGIKMLADETAPFDVSVSLAFEQAICVQGSDKMLADESAPWDISIAEIEIEAADCSFANDFVIVDGVKTEPVTSIPEIVLIAPEEGTINQVEEECEVEEGKLSNRGEWFDALRDQVMHDRWMREAEECERLMREAEKEMMRLRKHMDKLRRKHRRSVNAAYELRLVVFPLLTDPP